MNSPPDVTAATIRVRDWPARFENHRSRELRGRMEWYPQRIEFGTDYYLEVLDHEDGAVHYLVALLLVQVAATCSPRGTLLRESGRPHDAASLARMTGLRRDQIEAAIPRLVELGHLELCGDTAQTSRNPAHASRGGAETAPDERDDPAQRRDSTEQTEQDITNRQHAAQSREIAAQAPRDTDARWVRYIEAFLRGGKKLNQRDLEKALREWLSLDTDGQNSAILDAERIATERSANFIPLPQNHLIDRPWTRVGPERLLPDPPRGKGATTQREAERLFDIAVANGDVAS